MGGRTYTQLWFASGEPAGGDAVSGRGVFTRRHVSIQYSPPGDSEQPTLTVAHLPLDTSGLDVPALKVLAGEFSQGAAAHIEKLDETGAFLTGEFGGDDIFSVEGDGDIWNLGTMYAHQANVGGIAAVDDGTTALDMTLGNLFTNTPAENTSWSTSNPTNGIGGQLATFLVDNSGGYTVAWASGYTSVDSIEAADTGVHGRLLQFDGTTWHQLVATEDGQITNVTIDGGVFREIATRNVFGPSSAGNDSVTGDYNFAAGHGALDAVTVGKENIAIGHDALTSLTGTSNAGNYTIAIGYKAMEDFIGTTSFAEGNIAIGDNCFSAVLGTGEADAPNVVIGSFAAQDLKSSGVYDLLYNVIVGPWAAYNAVNMDSYNTLLGAYAGGSLTALGSYNIGIGASVFGGANGAGLDNIGIGESALYDITSGSQNTGIGSDSLQNVTEGDDNSGIGTNALLALTTGSYNVGVGYGVMDSITVGWYNLGLGYAAGENATGDSDNNVFIGKESGPTAGGEINDLLYIDNHVSDTPLIEGDFSGHTIDINGTLSKTAGSFKIDHPLDNRKHLYHGFVEGPEYGLIYRGQITLVDGSAVVNIDKECMMASGIFNAIAQNPTIYLQNTTGFVSVKASGIENGEFTIVAQESNCTDNVCWMVCAERADDFIMKSDATDEHGHLILEADKPARKLRYMDESEENRVERRAREVEKRQEERKREREERRLKRKYETKERRNGQSEAA
jgi:hypothetical protein